FIDSLNDRQKKVDRSIACLTALRVALYVAVLIATIITAVMVHPAMIAAGFGACLLIQIGIDPREEMLLECSSDDLKNRSKYFLHRGKWGQTALLLGNPASPVFQVLCYKTPSNEDDCVKFYLNW